MRKPRTLYVSPRYWAYLLGDDMLVIEPVGVQGGAFMQGDVEAWAEAIETAIDADEAELLCRFILAQRT